MRNESINRLGLYLSSTLFVLIGSGAVAIFLLFATSPRDIGGLGVTIWFLAVFCSLTAAFTLLRYNFRRRQYPEVHERLVLYLKSFRSALVISAFLVVALAMQSLRMLNLGDVILFLLTLGIIELYFRTKRHD